MTMEYEKALIRLMKQCSVRELSTFDARAMLTRWEVAEGDAYKIINKLTSDKFLDDRRFASAYIKDKLRFGGWGEHKIRNMLRMKKISPEVIDELMSALLNKEQMKDKILRELTKKAVQVKYKDIYDLKNKLMRFAFSRGFDAEQASDIVARVCEEMKENIKTL